LSKEFETFDRMMRKLIKVPHSKIKAKLDAEKASKKRKRSPTTGKDEANETGHNDRET
jgi:hypothetical protein